jgi:DNA-binding CsgD family transcriptional regulator
MGLTSKGVNMVERRRQRSDLYQHLYNESICSSEMMEAFCNQDSIYNKLNPFEYDERLLDLEDQLKKEFWRIVNTMLTPRQREVIRLYADGYTQCEIAKLLSVNQSSITKNLNGNIAYGKEKDKSNVMIYGGSKKRLNKIIENDEKIKKILAEMAAIREEKW